MYALARYTWRDTAEGQWWGWPAGVRAAIDLRPIPAQARKGTADGFGLFKLASGASLPRGALALGPELTSIPDTTEIEARLELSPGELSGVGDVRAAIAAILGPLADVTGADGVRPIMPDSRGRMRIWLGGLVADEPFDKVKHAHCLAAFRASVARAKAEGLAFAPGSQSRTAWDRLATSISRKTGWTPSEIHAAATGQPPKTTFGDTFVETSDTNLNEHTPTGPDPGTQWVEVDGSAWTVIAASNTVRHINTSASDFPASAKLNDALSSDDMAVSLTQTAQPGNGNGFLGPAARYAAAAETFYYGLLAETNSPANINKVVDGVSSSVQENTWSPAWPVVQKLEVDGDQLQLFVDDVAVEIPVTDPSISGNVRSGITCHHLTADNGFATDFGAVDIVAAAAGRRRRMLLGVD